MEKVYYDLHIHSCLSPCGDDEMTPNNIVNMALLKGLDVIALTDHNSCANGPAVKAAAERARLEWNRELLVLYGAEVETAEEVHVLCLFGLLEEAQAFQRALEPHFFEVSNRRDIYGEQWIMDDQDRVAGEEQRLLAFASRLSFYELFYMAEEMGGAFVPAHIDKPVYSVLSNMGFIPEELPISSVEVSQMGRENGFLLGNPAVGERFQVLTSSDAHYLGDIAERGRWLEVQERTAEAVLRCLKSGQTAR